MKRRQFLGFLGGAVAAGPTAAKVAADNVVSQSGLTALGRTPIASALAGGEIAAPAPPSMNGIGRHVLSKIRKMLLKEGLPKWKLMEIASRAEQYNGLDPDLGALVSVSGGFKVRKQRKRNFERLKAESIEWLMQEDERRQWHKTIADKFGVDGYVDWYR